MKINIDAIRNKEFTTTEKTELDRLFNELKSERGLENCGEFVLNDGELSYPRLELERQMIRTN